MQNTRNIGRNGELIAKRFLEEKGYFIINNNYIKNHGEIDLIAISEDSIIFIEVKLRNTLKYGHPLESISPKKVMKIKETANFYLIEHGIKDKQVRFDVISILKINNEYETLHIENAF